MIIRPLNPIYLIFAIFLPWRLTKTYVILSDSSITISAYYAQRNGTFKYKKYIFDYEQLLKFGFPNELKIKKQEPSISGSYGAYSSQEVDFLLLDGKAIPWNARPFTKKQVKTICEIIFKYIGKPPETNLANCVNFNLRPKI